MIYLSKSLNETERNYKIYDKVMLAVIRDLKNWRHLLEDTFIRRYYHKIVTIQRL